MIKTLRKYINFVSKGNFSVTLIISYLCGKREYVYYLPAIDSTLVISAATATKHAHVTHDKGKQTWHLNSNFICDNSLMNIYPNCPNVIKTFVVKDLHWRTIERLYYV